MPYNKWVTICITRRVLAEHLQKSQFSQIKNTTSVQRESGQNMHFKSIWINVDEACHTGLVMKVKQDKLKN